MVLPAVVTKMHRDLCEAAAPSIQPAPELGLTVVAVVIDVVVVAAGGVLVAITVPPYVRC